MRICGAKIGAKIAEKNKINKFKTASNKLSNAMEYRITHNRSKCRFETEVDGCTAHVEYSPIEGGIRIIHTIVPPAIEGRGVAAAIVKAALDFAESEKIRVVPVCSYVATYIKRHPQYENLL